MVDKIESLNCLNNLLTNKLSVDELIDKSNQKNNVCNLSIVPLTFINKNTCSIVGNENSKIQISVGGKPFLLTLFRSHENYYELICRINNPNLNEKDIILLTIEAFKKMEDVTN